MTQYSINGENSPFFPCSVGVGQGSALLPILLALYIAPLFHMLDQWILELDELDSVSPPLSSFLSFVDDGLLISTCSDFSSTHGSLKAAYGYMTGLLRDFGLTMEHSKMEFFDFYPDKSLRDIPPLDLGFGLPPLSSKRTWRYLGFYFDRQLTFKEHVKFYATKSISA